MTDRLATLERTESGGLIRFERVFPNPIEDVWSALTEPERLADWWPPFATNVRVDLREGGTMSFDWPGNKSWATPPKVGGFGSNGMFTGMPVYGKMRCGLPTHRRK